MRSRRGTADPRGSGPGSAHLLASAGGVPPRRPLVGGLVEAWLAAPGGPRRGPGAGGGSGHGRRTIARNTRMPLPPFVNKIPPVRDAATWRTRPIIRLTIDGAVGWGDHDEWARRRTGRAAIEIDRRRFRGRGDMPANEPVGGGSGGRRRTRGRVGVAMPMPRPLIQVPGPSSTEAPISSSSRREAAATSAIAASKATPFLWRKACGSR